MVSSMEQKVGFFDGFCILTRLEWLFLFWWVEWVYAQYLGVDGPWSHTSVQHLVPSKTVWERLRLEKNLAGLVAGNASWGVIMPYLGRKLERFHSRSNRSNRVGRWSTMAKSSPNSRLERGFKDLQCQWCCLNCCHHQRRRHHHVFFVISTLLLWFLDVHPLFLKVYVGHLKNQLLLKRL